MIDGFISISEASRLSGHCVQHLCKLARRGEFAACKPRGDKGGWHIARPSFEKWWQQKIGRTANR
jgi:hypothetical protein